MTSDEEEKRRLDGLALKLAAIMDGWHKDDVACVCACLSAYAIAQMPKREEALKRIFKFMQEVAADAH
jgi:hypothetical protein